MKLKSKMIASIMSICLVCAVFAIGVFALKTANLKIGGDVSFTATGVEATISNAALTGMTAPSGFATGGKIDTTMTQSQIDGQFATWQNLTMQFDENGTDIGFSFKVKNDADATTEKDNYIQISYTHSFGTQNPNVEVVSATTNSYIVKPGETNSFGLVVRVINKELDVATTTLSINVALTHQKAENLENNAYNGVTFSLPEDKPNTATITSFESDSTDVVLPAVVQSGEQYYTVTSIGENVFKQKEDITSIVIPWGVTSIGNWAFYGCSGLTSVVVPDSVTTIGDHAFGDCVNLTTIIIPNSVTNLGNITFADCSSLAYVTIPNGITTIGENVFSFCTSLTSITIPNSVVSIGDMAFYTSGLTSISIPDSVTSIGLEAFFDCSSLTSIIIGEGVTSDIYYSFEGCSANLESIVVSANNSVYDSRNNCNAIIETATNTLLLGCRNTIITSSVTAIAGSAFYTCKGLTSIVIPDNITSIGSGAFSYSDLTSIVFSARVTSIEWGTFSGCSGLTSITIPSSITRIDADAFADCENLITAKFENPNGWVQMVEEEYDIIEVPVTVTSEFTEDNANLLTTSRSPEINLIRKDA